MNVSLENKFIYIAIPKTGSSSCATSLGKYTTPCNVVLNRLCITDDDTTTSKLRKQIKLTRGCLDTTDKHITANELKKKIKDNYDKYFKFAFVRNPWDRLVSYYFWTNSNKKICFEKFIQNQKLKKTLDGTVRRRNQYEYVVDDKGEVIVDFIGRYENLQKDWNVVCEKIGICEKLPWINKRRNKKSYTEFYDDKTMNIVYEMYKKDIEYFEYGFDSFNEI